jgi:arylsulfatase A-like enzyme
MESMTDHVPESDRSPAESEASTGVSSAPSLDIGACVLIAAFAALASGVLEGIIFLLEHKVFGRPAYDSMHAIWLPSAFNILLFVPFGVAAWVVARVVPSRFRAWLVAFSLCCAAWFAVIGKFGELSHVAVALLTLGVSVQSARVLVRHLPGSLRAMRLATWALAALVLVTAVAVHPTRRWLESRALGSLPQARMAGSPNVVLIVMDTVRAKSLSVYGYPLATTPTLERLAGRGVVFDRAISTAPWTAPSHGSMFTGLYTDQLKVDWLVPLESTPRTLAEVLRDEGYATGGFVANVAQCTANLGFGRGFARYDDFHVLSPSQFLQASGFGRRAFLALRDLKVHRYAPDYRWDKPGSDVVDDFLEWQGEQKDRPYFAFLNFMDAHGPYRNGEQSYRGTRISDQAGRTDPYDQQRLLEARSWPMQQNYNARIAYVDAQIDRLLLELERRGTLENTVVVVTSDHGELFGEHGRWGHGFKAYTEVLHVPLLVVAPGRIPEGVRVADFVSLRDLPATIVEIVGVSANPFPGSSLSARWNATGGASSPVLVQFSETRLPGSKLPRPKTSSLVADGYQYIVTHNVKEELFEVANDPYSTADLVAAGQSGDVLARMRERLTQLLASPR